MTMLLGRGLFPVFVDFMMKLWYRCEVDLRGWISTKK